MSEFSTQRELTDRLGELFFIGIPGPGVDDATHSLLTQVRPSGVCLFARNIKSPDQTRKLTDELRSLLGENVLISIDQEGGRVDRLRRILEPMPSASQLRTFEDVETHARLTTAALLNLGINMNFAPVVDVDGRARDCSSNGLATRLFGTTADVVVSFAGAYIRILAESGLKTCVKHFPGLGASQVDSHEELPLVEIGQAEFESEDLQPYRRLKLDPAATAVMAAHAAYPSNPLQATTDEGARIPSSIGGGFISQILRAQIGFDGVVVTDDLEMGAIMKHFGIGEACVMALEAGNDQLLICNETANILNGFEAVRSAFASGRISESAVAASLSRIERFRRTTAAPREFDEGLFDRLSEDLRAFKERLA